MRRSWAVAILGVEEDIGSLDARLEGVKEGDDTVIASVRLEGVGTSSGARVPMNAHMVITFRNGKVVRGQVFQTLADAVEAVPGLE